MWCLVPLYLSFVSGLFVCFIVVIFIDMLIVTIIIILSCFFVCFALHVFLFCLILVLFCSLNNNCYAFPVLLLSCPVLFLSCPILIIIMVLSCLVFSHNNNNNNNMGEAGSEEVGLVRKQCYQCNGVNAKCFRCSCARSGRCCLSCRPRVI